MHASDERFGWLVTAIGFEQGLPSEKAFAIAPGDGMLIATNRGVVTYRPGTIAPKLIPVRILSQRVHDLAEAKATIPLEYPQNSLLVEVAGQSSRTFPEEFQYAFVLKNSKGDEVARQLSNDSQYAPTDLSPGDYVIEAIAFNRDLLASEPLSVKFSVGKAPFPWTATALGVLLAIAIVALIWAVIERRRIVLRNRELAAARFDLAHEAERERSRIARDLHDQTLADLRDLIMKSDRELPPGTGFRQDIESISTEVRRICEDLSPSVLENVGLIASLEFLLSHTVPDHKFDRGDEHGRRCRPSDECSASDLPDRTGSADEHKATCRSVARRDGYLYERPRQFSNDHPERWNPFLAARRQAPRRPRHRGHPYPRRLHSRFAEMGHIIRWPCQIPTFVIESRRTRSGRPSDARKLRY